MTNLELQEGIVQNLLLGLKKQSEAYLDLISNNEYTHDQRKDFEKELSDINKVLNELSGKTISYTVAELEALKNQFNDRLTQLNSIITNLEINTLKIEFDSLTPEQKAFLKGEKGDKGDKGDNSYQLAVRYGFVGNEIDYLNSLKGKDGVNGVNGINGADGQDGLSAYQIALNEGFEGTQLEWLQSLKGSGGDSVVYPIPFEKVGTETLKLNDELARLSQTLGQLQGGTISGVNINQLNGELQGVQGSISSLSNQLNFVFNKLNDVYQYNEQTDEEELVEYGLLSKVEQLYSQMNPPDDGGAM